MFGTPASSVAWHAAVRHDKMQSSQQFKRNNTESFIDNTFTDVDHSYTMKAAQEWQAAGLEHKHWANLVKGDVGGVLLKRQQFAEHAGKEAAEKARLDNVPLLRNDPKVPRAYLLKIKKALVDAILDSLTRANSS
ncbi:hypothetical protein BDN67DRAFT_1016329 [Paxillus ammoniavirescens]|nr:hypothetical protein BDN67DRAFT_1016329 [Paxillus ammoniavirescens]